MELRSRIVVDASGTEREVLQFPDKKITIYDYKKTTEFLKEARKLTKEAGIGQKEATWKPNLQYPDLPFALVLMSDMHYGSTNTDYDLLDKHFDMVENTPNFFLATNGDHTDNFNAIKHPTGMMENPLPPHFQAKALFQRLIELDRKGKVAVVAHGNHDLFGLDGGQDYFETFAEVMRAPIFDEGGILTIDTPQKYKIVLNHTYWGKSKINITNAAKRLLEYESAGEADIAWVGHTHQSSYEYLTKGGRDVIAVVSGTYKVDDPWARRNGIGGRSGHPGITLVMWPNERKIEVFKDIENARKFISDMIYIKNESWEQIDRIKNSR